MGPVAWAFKRSSLPLAAPRRRLHGPQTTPPVSRSLTTFPASMRSQVRSTWSSWRSSRAPQSVQNG